MSDKKKYKKVLSIDGGGIRGLISGADFTGDRTQDWSAYSHTVRSDRRHFDGRHPGDCPDEAR